MDCFKLTCQYLTDDCRWETRSTDFIGPLGIDYKCVDNMYVFEEWSLLVAVVLSFGIFFWIRVIANTATDFFSPTLQLIGIEADLPDHIGKNHSSTSSQPGMYI
jgi:hypothetical protein